MNQAGGPTPAGSAPDPAAGTASDADPDHPSAPTEGSGAGEWFAEDVIPTTNRPVDAEPFADGEPDTTAEEVNAPDGVLDADSDVVEAVELARRFEAERDEYLDHLRRLQAEFENFKRRVETQATEVRDRAALDLVRELLPVLDACDAAVSHGQDEVGPIRSQLLQTLEKQGLQPVVEADVPFDPNVHEAVMHEPGEGESVVAEVMRAGYLWRNNVVRAAMVKVRG